MKKFNCYILQLLTILTLKKCLTSLKFVIDKIQHVPIKKYKNLKDRLLQGLRIGCTNLELLIEKLEKYHEEKEKKKKNS